MGRDCSSGGVGSEDTEEELERTLARRRGSGLGTGGRLDADLVDIERVEG